MGNKSSSKKPQNNGKTPTLIQLNQAVDTLRAYHANTHANDPWKKPIGKFLKECDRVTAKDRTKSKAKKKSQSKQKKSLSKKPVQTPRSSRSNTSRTLHDWLTKKGIYHSNIEYMLRLQGIQYPSTDFKSYTSSDFDELYGFCMQQKKDEHDQYSLQCKLSKLETHWTKITKQKRIQKQKPLNKKKVKKSAHIRKKKIKSKKSVPASKSRRSQPGTISLLSQQQKMFTYKEVLVYGYIRIHSEELLPNIIIPIDICHISLRYFSHNEIFLIHFPIGTLDPLCIKVRSDFYTQHTMKIYELSSNQQHEVTAFVDDKWRIRESSLTFKQSIQLPPVITTKLNAAYNKYYRFHNVAADYYPNASTDTYSIVFNRGDGHESSKEAMWNKKCYAIAFNAREFHKNDTSSIVGFKYALPNCKRELSQLLYSDRYGLIAVGGGISIYNLSFRNEQFYKQDRKTWKWLSFGHLQSRRKQFSTVMLDAKRLLVVGGDKRSDPKSELIDLSGHRNKRTTVTDCNGSRRKCGIMYDNYNKRVFVAGGTMTTVDEFYDLNQDKWCVYAKPTGYQRLFINWPSVYSSDMEVIFKTDGIGNVAFTDLRENKQEWEIYRANIEFNLSGVYRVLN
eukprot:1070073_1